MDKYLRNIDIMLAVVAVVGFMLFLPESPQRDGMLTQFFGYMLGAFAACGFGSLTHRLIFTDLRPHLFVSDYKKLIGASSFRFLWIGLWMMGYMIWLIRT